MSSPRKVLFICVHNSARSQMAEEYLRRFGGDRFEAASAGYEPTGINPFVLEVMKEDGFDLTGKGTTSIHDLQTRGMSFNEVITVCNRAQEKECPIFSGIVFSRHSWPFPDPESFTGSREEKLSQTRELRDIIRDRVRMYVDSHGV